MVNRDDDWYDNCPLLNRGIGIGECYDVQMVRCHFIKESVLHFTLDRQLADKLCEPCPYNQLVDNSGKDAPQG